MNRTMKNFQVVKWVIGLLLGATSARAQLALPIEYRHVSQGETWHNYQSGTGVPISQTVGNPAGSDGRQPNSNESTGTFTPPTAGQFRSFISFGAAPGLTAAGQTAVAASGTLNDGATPFSGAVAEQMNLPRATVGGQIVMILRRGQVGAPYLSRPVSFSFGSVVPPPENSELGVLLQSVPNTAYWLPEPFSINAHGGAGYYWSPHARQVYAIQPGPLSITWRKATAYNVNNPPPAGYNNPNGPVSFQTNGANIFLLYTENYTVSGSAVRPPRKMYWTERGFQKTGRPIAVPGARVGAVNIVYNNNFPGTVTNEFVEIGSSTPTAGTTNSTLKELRTLWYDRDQKSIFAYNAEGRVFVELLGMRGRMGRLSFRWESRLSMSANRRCRRMSSWSWVSASSLLKGVHWTSFIPSRCSRESSMILPFVTARTRRADLSCMPSGRPST